MKTLPCHFRVLGRKLCQTLTKFAHKQSQTRTPLYQCMYQVWLKSHDIYSSYHPENENIGLCPVDNFVKI